MKKSELIELIKEVLSEHNGAPGQVGFSPMYPGQMSMHLGHGIHVPLTQQPTQHFHGPTREATPEEAMFGYVAIILAGAAILAVAAPQLWSGIKNKYKQFKNDIENQKLGETVSLEDLAKEIEAATNKLTPTVKKTLGRMFNDAKNAETPKELGAQVSKIRKHIQRYGKTLQELDL
jgi:hypothetical protein